jgi:hypothetical protein
MRRAVYYLIGMTLVLAALSLRPARAEHFDIVLSIKSSRGSAEAHWDTSPPEGGRNPRQSVTAAVGEELLVEWSLRSEFPHGAMKRVRVRLFAAPETEIGQRNLPLPSVPRLFDNSFIADFLPHHSARGQLRFRVRKPGAYLVRLESEQTQEEHGHEHFAALDLRVE